MFSEFQKSLGIQFEKNDGETVVLTLPVTDSILNTSKIAHGGNHIALGNAAMRALVGPDATQVCATVEYLDKVSPDGVMRAEARLLRNGRSFVFAEAHMYDDDRLVARLSTQYSRIFLTDKVTCQKIPQVNEQISFIELSRPCEKASSEQDRMVRNLFNLRDLFPALITHSEELSLSLKTGLYHAGSDGYVDRAVYGILADNTLGFACFAQGSAVVTVRLAINYIEPVKVGTTLYCRAQIEGCSGNIYFTSGSIWADNRIIGTCEGVFSAVMSLDEFKQALL